MSTITREFTKEQLIARANHLLCVGKAFLAQHPEYDGMAKDVELFGIALASLEAEAVGEFYHEKQGGWYQISEGDKVPDNRRIKLYIATPAPVSVPAGYRLQPISEYDAMCAAMLQGADGNSPVIPDGWVACSERMPDSDDFVYIWPRPDFGVELHVAQYGKFDRRDTGWYAQLYEQNFGIEYQPITVTHWMPLPAAPQQEVKNG
ncbi:DUF551 domain-containing protein [Enterobacter ludwigii]|uniref:DUF551 domain-containing protein n=1 Tax=Enterobacter ludwigii TaxID=299767 RepID=UPI003C30A8D1